MYNSLIDKAKLMEDLTHGQVVIITARWILVLAGLMLALWNPGDLGELRVALVLILGLALGNFFLHAQVIMRKPAIPTVAYLASAADLAIITVIVYLGGGFGASVYVFYLPALLAISVAFPTAVTASYALGAMGAYGLLALQTAAPSQADEVFTQLLIMGAVAYCGNVYWRIEHNRRGALAPEKKEPEKKEQPS